MTTDDLAVYLNRPTREAARKWAHRNGLVAVRQGHSRLLFYARRDVDARCVAVVNREPVRWSA